MNPYFIDDSILNQPVYGLTKALAEYDESQHPRDELGRWTDTDGGEFYHGTSQIVLDSILKEGIQTSHVGEVWPDFSRKEHVYLTTTKDRARVWAEEAERRHYVDIAKQAWPKDASSQYTEGYHAAVLTVRVPKDQVEKVVSDQNFGDDSPNLEFNGSIPPSWIVAAETAFIPFNTGAAEDWKSYPVKRAAAAAAASKEAFVTMYLVVTWLESQPRERQRVKE